MTSSPLPPRSETIAMHRTSPLHVAANCALKATLGTLLRLVKFSDQTSCSVGEHLAERARPDRRLHRRTSLLGDFASSTE